MDFLIDDLGVDKIIEFIQSSRYYIVKGDHKEPIKKTYYPNCLILGQNQNADVMHQVAQPSSGESSQVI